MNTKFILKKYIMFLLLYTLVIQITSSKVNRKKIPIMVIKRVDIDYANEDYGSVNATVSRISRNDFGVTVYANFVKNLTSGLYADVQVYALYSNTYRRMPLTLNHQDLCHFLANQEYAKYMDNHDFLFKNKHFPKSCPIFAGLYYLKDYVYDASKYPRLPWQEMMTEVKLHVEDVLIAIAKIYVVNNQEYIEVVG